MKTDTPTHPARSLRRIIKTLPAALLGGSLAAAGLAGLALLVPLNMGGCGSDVGSNLGSIAGGNLNSIHTGNAAVDRVGVGTAANAANQGLQALTLDERQETNLGRDVALRVTNQFGVVDDDSLNRYVTLVGMTVADASLRTDYPYCFCVVNSDEVNAFSGPGGYVMITRGALAKMQDESELAGVLGHEIGHIVKHHGLEAVRRAKLSVVGGAALKTQEFYNQFSQASDAASDLVLNVGFSQSEESQADAEAARYAAAAGYDPNGYLRFLQRMQADQGAAGSGGKLFPTHPGLGDRAKRVADQIAREGTGGKGQTNADRFAANVRR